MSYTVVEEFIVSRDGAAVHHTENGSVVELTDAEAVELVAAGKVQPVGLDPADLEAVREWMAAHEDAIKEWVGAETLDPGTAATSASESTPPAS